MRIKPSLFWGIVVIVFVISVVVSLIPVSGEILSQIILLAGFMFLCSFGFNIDWSKSRVPPKKIQTIEGIITIWICALMIGLLLGDIFEPISKSSFVLFFSLFLGVTLGGFVKLQTS